MSCEMHATICQRFFFNEFYELIEGTEKSVGAPQLDGGRSARGS